MSRFLVRNAISCSRLDSVLEGPLGGLEDLAVGPERGRRAPVLRGGPADHRAHGDAALVILRPDVAVPADLDLEHPGQGVHHGHADAVQPAGHRVGLPVELAARVQRGHHDLEGRAVLHRVLVHGDAAAVVLHAHSAVGEQRHVDGVGFPGERLVDGVVHDLVDQVMQAPLARRADVHPRSLTDRFEALEYRDRTCIVGQAETPSCIRSAQPSPPRRGHPCALPFYLRPTTTWAVLAC